MSQSVTGIEEGTLDFDPAKHQPELLRAWRVFVETGVIAREVVPSHIAESWVRSKGFKVDPLRFSPNSYEQDDKYKKRIARNRQLRDIARPILENVYNSLERTRYLVVLYDSDGYHLTRIGKRADLQRSTKYKIREGLCFGENHVGTSGFSLAKRLEKPIHIIGCEHYSALLHYVTGAYAPIRAPMKGELIGVVGVAGSQTHPNPHTMGIVIAASTAIENLLELDQARSELFIYSKSLQIAMDSLEDGVILVNKRGRINEINRFAREALGLEKKDTKGQHITDLPVLSSLKGTIMLALQSKDQEGREVECQIHNQIFLASIRFVRKSQQHEVEGVMVQLKSVRRLSQMFQNYTIDKPKHTIENMVGSSDRIKEIKSTARIAANSNVPVIIEGETGTGKEVVAEAIHNASSRKACPFIVVNCAAIPPELLETTLFGHEKGSFTGANRTHVGKFELADRGTLFLDEIAEMPPGMQGKLLRAIEERKIERVGGRRAFPIDVKILAATNKNLPRLVEANAFREDLFYRINVFRIMLPPLREIKKDIPAFVYHFVAEFAALFQKDVSRVSDAYFEVLLRYHWPGNIRELKNAIQYSIARMDTDTLQPSHIAGFFEENNNAGYQAFPVQNLEKLVIIERQAILQALESHHGNKSKTARALGIGRATLYRKMKEMFHSETDVSN